MKWLLISLALFVVYTYLLYPVILKLFLSLAERPVRQEPVTPSVSIIIAAHNEAADIGARIENLLALDYPKERLEIIVASDGSDDETVPVAERYRDQGVMIVASGEQQGKSPTQNLAVAKTTGDILCFTDADTRFAPDFLRRLVANFADPEVGCVTGRLVYTNTEQSAISYSAGSLYWRYELAVRERESHLGLLSVVSGQCMAVRSELFRPIPSFTGDDCIVPLDCLLAGRRVVYEPLALACDTVISRVENELRSRVRMAVRTLHGTWARRGLLNLRRYPGIAWVIISHKLCRYAVPLALIGIFGINLVLLGQPFWVGVFAAQCGFYVAAVDGWRRDRWVPATLGQQRRGLAYMSGFAFSFCVANLGFLLGILQSLWGQRIVAYTAGE